MSGNKGATPHRNTSKVSVRPARPAPKLLTIGKPILGWQRVPELARRQLDILISLQPKVLRGDDPDAIHDMRVASRRLQQILDLLYPKPRPQKIRKLRRIIRRARTTLSGVRNCDVLLQRVEKLLARKRLEHFS